MAKKIIRHIWKKRAAYMLSVLSVAVGIGFYASFFMGGRASALSGVTLTDTDIIGYGLDGRDFTIIWTPGSAPDGYLFTQVFITTSGVNLVTSTLDTTGCYGAACVSVGYLNQFAIGSLTIPQYMQKDSVSSNWTTSTLAGNTSYIAWVFVSTTNPTNSILVSSTAL